MDKFVAPDHISHFSFDNVDYHRDDNGHFEIRHPDHKQAALMHGALPYVPGETPNFEAPPAPTRFPGADEELAAKDEVIADKDAEIAALRAQLASERAEKTQGAPGGTDTPASGADAPGDTSGSTGDITQTVDVDTLDRDGLVAILKERGVAVPGNISKDAALKLVKGE